MDGKKSTTTQPGDFSKDRIERILAEARGEAQTVPLVSRAPKPPSRIRGSSWTTPERIKLPRELLSDYPVTLSLRTWAVINEAREKFPRRPQLLDFCKEVLANLTPTFCAEVKAARLHGPRAVSHLDGLLDSLLLHNEHSEPILANLRQESMRSKERVIFIHELLRAEEEARRSPQSSGKAGARKLERLQDKRGKKPVQQIIDRDRDMARLAFEERPPLAIATYLDDCNYPTPKTWRTPKFAPKGEKYETGIRVSKLRKSFSELISKAKRKYPIPAPAPN